MNKMQEALRQKCARLAKPLPKPLIKHDKAKEEGFFIYLGFSGN